MQQCAFLQRYKTPKALAKAWLEGSVSPEAGFACSLCSLCDAVCPEGIRPSEMVLRMRQAAAESGEADLSRYRPLLQYEKRGKSNLLSYYGLPQGCDTVFFPGCTLAGTRPRSVKALFGCLQGMYPGLGIVLDCCGKPSHDLGLLRRFSSDFDALRDFCAASGIHRVILACPSCYKVFRRHAPEIEAVTAYEVLAEHGITPSEKAGGEVVLHDPCPVRFEDGLQEAVRSLVADTGVRIREMRHRGMRTLCCGEGGAVALREPELARRWRDKRWSEAEGRRILTYCAGCAAFLGTRGRTDHVADLILRPGETMSRRASPARPPMTYLHRWRLKRAFRRKLRPAKSGPRRRVLGASAERPQREGAGKSPPRSS